jgi:hypothetical protein
MLAAGASAMCCFTGPVTSVSATRIFARMLAGGRQALVYHMTVEAPAALAMVLPLPVVAGSGEQALQFVDLTGYRRLFDDLGDGFAQWAPAPASDGEISLPTPKPLVVAEVGDFVASFVPTIADFARLDARFRFAPGIWGQLPHYAAYGFAVFQLKPGRIQPQPMAFTFPSALPRRLFFPTMHIHDGQVHPMTTFDHLLYAQGGGLDLSFADWEESARLAKTFIDPAATKGLVDGGDHVHRRTISGILPNQDTLV